MSPPIANLSAFLSELKRRRVFRVAVVYAGVAFIIIQIIDGAFDYLPIPDWVGTAIIVVLLVGFPIAVGLAWAFDITEKGVVRTAAKEEAVEAKTPPRPFIGNKTLAIVAAVAVAVAVWSWWGRPSTAGSITSIAVLPMENLMNDPDQEYFVDGMHEALISELGKISALRVISRTSAMHYKDTDKLLPEIASELGVDAIVEGSVLRAGDQVRITAQLVGTAPERHLWTDSYTHDLRDILTLHSEVARAIAKEIKVTLTPEEEARLASTQPVDPEAYMTYLMGRYHYNTWLEEGLEKGLNYFQQAIDIDSSYAPAYAGVADCYSLLSLFTFLSPMEAAPRAKEAAMKAIELDESLAEAHAALGVNKLLFDWDWQGAEQEFKRALDLNPHSDNTLKHYSFYLIVMGRYDEGIAATRRMIALDPLTLTSHIHLGFSYFKSRRYDESIIQLNKTLEMEPNLHYAHMQLAWNYAMKGMATEALVASKNALALVPITDDQYLLGTLGWVAGVAGHREEALEFLERLKELSTQKWVDPAYIALIYLGMGDKDHSFQWLSKAREDRSPTMVYLKVDPFWDDLRDDPRFQDLLRRMNFPE